MARIKDQSDVDRPNLLERAFAAGCTRIAVVSLHAGAGARTVVESIAVEFHRRGIPTGITRAPRLPLDASDVSEQVTRVTLPEGTLVATTRSLAEGSPLELVHEVDCRTALGQLGLYRVVQAGDVAVYGPDDPAALGDVMSMLEQQSGGLALADGAWERRGFAGPEVSQGVILALGPGYSGSPERSAAAVAYVVETLRIPPCDERLAETWRQSVQRGSPAVLDEHGRTVDFLPSDSVDPTSWFDALERPAAAVVLPQGLHDAFLAPLVRRPARFPLVVGDPTRLQIAPVWFKGWLKGGGSFHCVRPVELLAVATNPLNPSGPDADADRFLRLVDDALPGVAVHDVRLEAAGRNRKPVWKFWA